MKQEHIKQYKQTQDKIEDLRKVIAEKQAIFNKENETIFQEIDMLSDEFKEYKSVLEFEAEEYYKATDKKKHECGIGIRETIKLKYDDLAALSWAKTNMAVIVKESIDKKVFDKYAKENKLDFVEIDKVIKITFPPNGLILEDQNE